MILLLYGFCENLFEGRFGLRFWTRLMALWECNNLSIKCQKTLLLFCPQGQHDMFSLTFSSCLQSEFNKVIKEQAVTMKKSTDPKGQRTEETGYLTFTLLSDSHLQRDRATSPNYFNEMFWKRSAFSGKLLCPLLLINVGGEVVVNKRKYKIWKMD